jgi:hypothetical protein
MRPVGLLSFAAVLLVLCVVGSPVPASADWMGCYAGVGGTFTGGDPGDRSGCKVRYVGTDNGVGEYEYYDCSDPSKNATCFYTYNLPLPD